MWQVKSYRQYEKMTLSAGLVFLIGEHTTYYEHNWFTKEESM